jgi:hypothetical protein
MRLRVFGRTADDKGTQLEQLTRRLLERLGYKHLALNVVGSGGSEIDVLGDYPIPGPLGPASLRVIGECKAYESPVTLPDWLKFLGKLFVEEAKAPGEVRGLFVALSGANGNVRGSVEELRNRRKTIDFVDAENLVALTQNEFDVPRLENVVQRCAQLVPDPVAEFSLGYYELRAFWVLQFANGTFSILCGRNLEETPSPELVAMVAAQLQGSKHRDLYQEDEHRRRLVDTRKLILSRLLMDRAVLSKAALSVPEGPFVPATPDVELLLEDLVGAGAVDKVGEDYSVDRVVEAGDARVGILLELTDERTFLSGICSPGWLSLIDDTLLEEISKIQGDLPIPQEVRNEALCLLRWSPTALAWSIRPAPMLVAHRRTAEEGAKHVANDIRYFRVQLLRFAVSDFMVGPYKEVHFEKLDLREVEFLRRAKFKSSTKVELEVEVSERFATARTTPELGGGIARIWLHEEGPEPWNFGAPNREASPEPDDGNAAG